MEKTKTEIKLKRVELCDAAAYKAMMRRSFSRRIEDIFGAPDGGPIPSADDVDRAFEEGAHVWHLVCDAARIGGAIVMPNDETGRYSLELLFIDPAFYGKGIGRHAWQAIEAQYPQARVWELYTPCFEKRNLHFYINVCGFHVVEYFNARHPDTQVQEGMTGKEEFFRFEKTMS